MFLAFHLLTSSAYTCVYYVRHPNYTNNLTILVDYEKYQRQAVGEFNVHITVVMRLHLLFMSLYEERFHCSTILLKCKLYFSIGMPPSSIISLPPDYVI